MQSAHFIPLIFHSFPVDVESSFSDRGSDCINQHTPYLCPLPNGAPAGCCCFLYHLCWHGERQLHGPRALFSLQNRKSTLLSDAHWRQKTNQPGSRGMRLQAEEDDNSSSRCPTPLCTWSRFTVLYALVRVEGKFLCQQPEHTGCLTVSS